MKSYLVIIFEIVGLIGTLLGLTGYNIIGLKEAIGAFVFALVLIIILNELRYNLKEDFGKKFKAIESPLTKFANAVAEIQKFLKEKFKFVPLHKVKADLVIQERSPLSLTSFGTNLLEGSGANEIVNTHYDTLSQKINEANPQSALDIQDKCTFIIADIQDEDYMKPLKDFVYQNPHFQNEPIEYLDVLRAMAIYLRDKYLEEHPALKPLEG